MSEAFDAFGRLDCATKEGKLWWEARVEDALDSSGMFEEPDTDPKQIMDPPELCACGEPATREYIGGRITLFCNACGRFSSSHIESELQKQWKDEA